LKLDHAVAGQGPAIVLLHGFANDRTLWDPQVEALRGRWRVIVPSLRGFGDSPDTDGAPVSMDTYADDVVALLDELGIERAVVGGISMGGYVALSLALRHGHRLRGLVLAGTRAAADPPEWAAYREQMVRTVRERGAEAVVENYGDKPFAPGCSLAVKDRLRTMIRRQPTQGLASGTLGMARRPDRSKDLARIGVPTLVVHGTEDAYVPIAEAQAMQRAIPDARFVAIAGAGHLCNADHPVEFNAALEAFMEVLPA
jgi:3-oxoadipate enol-lactonase